MLIMKKTTLAILAFSSSMAFAGTMGPVCVPGNVTVPCEASAWDFGGYALYLNPTYSGPMSDVGSFENISQQFPSEGFTTNTHNINNIKQSQPWQWGFKLEGSYHYGMGNDVNLNWYHYSNNTSHAYALGANIVNADFSEAFQYTTTLKPQWDAVNLEFGQHVDFTEATKIRFHAGAQFGRVDTTAKATFNNGFGLDGFASEGDVIGSFNNRSSYNGFGPRTGADLSYAFSNGLSLYGNGAAALLVGQSKFTNYLTTHNVNGAGDVFTTDNYLSQWAATTIVPELEAKLGAMYTYAMASGNLTFDAGYMWVNYFNVQTSNALKTGPQNPDGGRDPIESSEIAKNDFSLNGVYFGLNWRGNLG